MTVIKHKMMLAKIARRQKFQNVCAPPDDDLDVDGIFFKRKVRLSFWVICKQLRPPINWDLELFCHWMSWFGDDPAKEMLFLFGFWRTFLQKNLSNDQFSNCRWNKFQYFGSKHLFRPHILKTFQMHCNIQKLSS